MIILESIDNYSIINRRENIVDRWSSIENWNEVDRIDRNEGGWVKQVDFGGRGRV